MSFLNLRVLTDEFAHLLDDVSVREHLFLQAVGGGGDVGDQPNNLINHLTIDSFQNKVEMVNEVILFIHH